MRRFKNCTPINQSFHDKNTFRAPASHIAPNGIIEARNDKHARFLAGLAATGILEEISSIPDPEPKKLPGPPRRFQNVSRQMQRFFPPDRAQSFVNNRDVQPGEIITAKTDAAVIFWRRFVPPNGPLIELEE